MNETDVGQSTHSTRKKVLVTGSTGYVAGRLIPLLLESGFHVRAMGRSLEKMAGRPWANHQRIELVRGDIMDRASLKKAIHGCHVLYYLVHSMISQKGHYRQADLVGAGNMARAAEEEKADQIIYLGGLGDITHKNISKHLISRNEVGTVLQKGRVPVTILRAAMILGSGSASFEILRYLAERLPFMITPKWVSMPTQPIAITNVLEYLKGCIEHPGTIGKTFDIGGPDILAYRDLFRIFALEAGLPKPVMLPVPVLTPKLSSLWIHLVTPVPSEIARPLTEGLSLPTICTESSIKKIIPLHLISCREAIKRALDRIRQHQVDTSWTDAGDMTYPEWSYSGDSAYSGGTHLTCGYKATCEGTGKDLWPIVKKLGGKTGYYSTGNIWKLQGIFDSCLGGIGMRKGRRSEKHLNVGDALDFWRVLEVESEHRLLLLSEMKKTGDTLLEITLTNSGNNTCEIKVMLTFMPKGILGMGCWYMLSPIQHHALRHMITGIIMAAGLNILTYPEPLIN